jgi:hypothetical protein
MQTHGGSPAGVAIEAMERRWYVEMKVDWNRDGLFDHPLSDLSNFADNITVDRSLAGSAPQEIMLIEGAAAAELRFDIGGHDGQDFEGLNLVAAFSPYNGLSPFYNLDPVGCEITYRIGIDTSVGIVWYSQFVGNIRTITPNRASNTVSITALDRVEKLRTPVRFPVWAISDYMAQRGYELAQLAESNAVIDHCLRFGDTSPTPYRPMYPEEFTPLDAERDDGVRFWLSGTGAYFPTVANMTGDTGQGFPEMEGAGADMYGDTGNPHPDSDAGYQPRALAAMGSDNTGLTSSDLNSAAFLTYWGLDRNTDNLYAMHFVGFTLNNLGPSGSWWWNTGNTTTVIQCHAGFHLKLMITIFQGNIRAEIRNYLTNAGFVSDWVSMPFTNHIQVDVVFKNHPTFEGGRYFAIQLNRTTSHYTAMGDIATVLDGSFDPFTAYVTLEHKAGVSDVYWSSRFSIEDQDVYDDAKITANSRREAKYAAVLDQGLNRLTHLPVTNAEDAWDIITQVAAAELGSVFWDENGVFRFWNRDTIIDKQDTTWRTFSMDHVQGLQITNSFDSIRNIVTSESKRGFARTQVSYDSQSIEEFYIPPLTAIKFIRFVDNIQSFGLWKVTRYQTDYDPGNYPVTYPFWDNDGNYEGYVAQWLDPVLGWTEKNGLIGGLDIYPYGNEDGSITIEIWNGWNEPARVATGGSGDSSSAALRILGSEVITDETAVLAVSDTDSIAKYGRRNLPLTGDWVQWQPDVVTSLLEYTLPRTLQPIPTTDAITVSGDPRLQLGDRVDIVDPDGMGERIGLQIYGIQRSYTRDTGLVDTLTVEMLAPPRIGIWDSAQYGLWDQTFIWS